MVRTTRDRLRHCRIDATPVTLAGSDRPATGSAGGRDHGFDHRLDRELAREEVGRTPFGIYVHVPFCSHRCGYCAFVTWTPGDDGRRWEARHRDWADAATAEIRRAAHWLDGAHPPVESIYFGGGTPTAVAPHLLVQVLRAATDDFPVVDDLEVTVEANPDGLGPEHLDHLVAAGVTRVSFGMQSASEAVLRTLDRTHPGSLAPMAVDAARRAGVAHVGVDLIHGTPGETDAMWDETLAAALSSGVDHLAAYALSIEPGTRLAARIRSGTLPEPDPDVAARRYEATDAACRAGGLEWYELSNWATHDDARCRHNLGTWRDHDWWGIGPGAHAHIGRQRWWNHRSERRWVEEVRAGHLPVEGHERLDDAERRCERIMLGIRLREGLPTDVGLDTASVAELEHDGLVRVVAGGSRADRVVLTDRGRLVADSVVRRLL